MSATGVFTDVYRSRYATVADIGAALDAMKLSYFKIGEKGHDGGSPALPKAPDPTRTDVEAQYDQAGTPLSAHDSYFKKTLAAGDVSASSEVLTVVCLTTSGEGNDDGFGNDPTYYELGIFDEDDVMIAYCTFNEEIKTSDKAIQQTVTVTF